MKILRGDDPNNIELVVKLICDGKPVALPTETVYGLAADAFCEKAVGSIFDIKGRPSNDPLIVHVATFEQIESIAFVPSVLAKLSEAFWPGPLTVVLRKKDSIPGIVTSGLPTVAVRIPAHPLFREVLEKVGRPLAAPSANPFGSVSPTRAEHIVSSFGENSPYILDGGSTEHGIESTILSLAETIPVILRLGPLSSDDLNSVLGSLPRKQLNAEGSIPKAPGSLPRHYSPNTSLQLHPNSAAIHRSIQNASNPQTVGVILLKQPSPTEKWPKWSKVLWLSESGNLNEAAFNLYDALRKMDSDPLIEEIHCHAAPDKGIGSAINDKLSRAAH